MSEQPKSLYEMVREWRAEAKELDYPGQIFGATHTEHANQLEAQLKAWREVYDRDADEAHVYEIFERLLGLPAEKTRP